MGRLLWLPFWYSVHQASFRKGVQEALTSKVCGPRYYVVKMLEKSQLIQGAMFQRYRIIWQFCKYVYNLTVRAASATRWRTFPSRSVRLVPGTRSKWPSRTNWKHWNTHVLQSSFYYLHHSLFQVYPYLTHHCCAFLQLGFTTLKNNYSYMYFKSRQWSMWG